MKAEKKLAMNLAFGLLSVMAMACEKPSVSECDKSHSVSMDYTITFKEMIKTNDYELFDPNFENKEFALQGSVISQSAAEIEAVLVHLNTKVVNTEKIIKDMDKLGLRPAQAEELLVFSENHSHMERWRFPIVALGSYWVNEHDRNRRSVACLDVDDHSTNLYLVEFDNYWSERYHFHFLAVRK